jgi:hypothetical protein
MIKMNASNHSSKCKESEQHYYDFICNERSELIPEPIIDHIEHCQKCMEQIAQLKEVLRQAEDDISSRKAQIRTAIAYMLQLHFTYIDKPVGCNIIKPFLPFLLDPKLEIKIPTPITVHLDNCQQCCEDLKVIGQLNLNSKQLSRLTQFFADKPVKDTVSCSTAQLSVPSVAVMNWSGIAAETLKHLCVCRVCCELLYEERQQIYDSLPEYNQSPEFPCESVRATDIFDYCFPYGIDPTANGYAKFRSVLTSHLQSCRVCLAKMQQLHKTIRSIIERPESQVVTIYHIDESAKAETVSEPDDLYAGFPIRVERTDSEAVGDERSESIIDFTTASKQKASTGNLIRLFKPGVVAAAVILIAVALFISIPTTKAVTVEQIYKAIEKIRNVYIAKFDPSREEPKQELWVSMELNIYMAKAGNEMVLWDIGNGLKKTKLPNTGTIETVSLTEEKLVDIEKKMGGYLGLVPFENMSDIPAGYRWDCVTDEYTQAAAEQVEVYDLIWDEKAHDGSIVIYKWRFFLDPKTYLPHRTEFYQKLTANREYVLQSVNTAQYLDKSEIQAVLKEAGF